MTGPLAQQFASLREYLGRSVIPSENEHSPKLGDSLAALSSIERHAQDMEKALEKIHSEAVLGVQSDRRLPYLTHIGVLAATALALSASGAPHSQEHGPEKEEERPCPDCRWPIACLSRGEVDPGYCLIVAREKGTPDDAA